jgi:DNA-binding MarR family transcriptional regulator
MRCEKLTVVKPAADAAEPGRYVLDDQVGFLLLVALQRHTSIFTTRMIEGLTQTQFAALAKLHEVGPCSQNHLGRLIYLDAATIKGVVDRLGARGFITALTDRGRQVTEAAQLVAAEITAATLAAFSEDEQGLVAQLLRKLA